MIRRIIFCLGSNLGNRELYITNAIQELQKLLELRNLKYSSILENKALLKIDSPKEWDLNFLNISISADFDSNKFSYEKVINIIKKIEQKLGRNFNAERWSPRVIDIDILAIDNLKIEIENKLIIPHYDLLNRDFFISTFKEIEPEIFSQLEIILS